MTAEDTLRRRCRRLMLAFPVWHRRERGLEMLTTIVDSTEPGRRWPSLSAMADILVGGLRCRLRPPRGVLFAFITGVVAVFAALAGSTIAARAASSTPPPTDAQAASVAQAALGQPPLNLPGPIATCTYFCDYKWDRGGDQVVTFSEPFEENSGVDYVKVGYWTPNEQIDSTLSAARQRLAAQEWEVDAVAYSGPTTYFKARKAGLSVEVAGTPDTSLPPSTPTVSLQVAHEPREGVAIAAVAGLIGGLLTGWLLAVWVLQRHRRHRPEVWAPALAWGALTLLVMFFIEMQMVNYLIAVVMGGSTVSFAELTLLPAVVVSGLLFHPTITWILAATVLINLVPAGMPIRALTPEIAMTPEVAGGRDIDH